MLSTDFATVRAVLRTEKRMREWVFRAEKEKRRTKVAEIDSALEALDRIEWTVRGTLEHPHADLFERNEKG